MEKVTFNGVEYDARHGGPFDRGSADSYYSREPDPHYYVGATGLSERINKLYPSEEEAYSAGYLHNEQSGSKKDYD